MNCACTNDLDHFDHFKPQPVGPKTAERLSASQEKELAAAVASGDVKAKERLICANLGLVVTIARKFCSRGLSLDDLVGEGNLGLIRATEEFDPKFNTRFSTYAAYWIKEAIRCALINTTATIRIPSHLINLMNKWRRMEQAMTLELGCAPLAEEIGSRLGLSKPQMKLITQAQQAGRLKLESSFDDTNGFSPMVLDFRESHTYQIETKEESQELEKRLCTLDSRERTVLTQRFGLDGEMPRTLSEVGENLGITREWTRKIELRALRRLA